MLFFTGIGFGIEAGSWCIRIHPTLAVVVSEYDRLFSYHRVAMMSSSLIIDNLNIQSWHLRMMSGDGISAPLSPSTIQNLSHRIFDWYRMTVSCMTLTKGDFYFIYSFELLKSIKCDVVVESLAYTPSCNYLQLLRCYLYLKIIHAITSSTTISTKLFKLLLKEEILQSVHGQKLTG